MNELLEKERKKKMKEELERKRVEEENRRKKQEEEIKRKEEEKRKLQERIKEEEKLRREEEEKLKQEEKSKHEQEELQKQLKLKEEEVKLEQKQLKNQSTVKDEEPKEEEEEEQSGDKIKLTIEKIDTRYVSKNAFVESQIRIKTYKTIEAVIKSEKFTENAELKKIANSLKRVINTTISQVPTSRIEVEKKSNEIIKHIQESTKHEEVYYFILINAAKRIIDQAKAQVSIQQRSAFSYSNLALRICKVFPAFTEVLLAQFNISCPFTIPQYIPEDSPDYFRELGFEERDGKFENAENYLEKMGGIISLYAALIQTPTPRCMNSFHSSFQLNIHMD
jgi:nucleoporin GLE1